MSPRADGVRVVLKVTPRAARSAVDGVALDDRGQARLMVRVTAPPDAGEANAAVIRLLAKRWRVPARDIRLISGAAARRKILQIEGPPERLLAELAAIEQPDRQASGEGG